MEAAVRLSVSGGRAVETTILLVIIFSSTPLTAQSLSDAATEKVTAATTAPDAKASNLWVRKQLISDWGGARTAMENAGLTLSLTYQQVLQLNMHGGLETKNGHDIGGNYTLGLELDFEKMFNLHGGSFFMETQGSYGGEADDFDGEKIGGLFQTNQIAGTEESIFVNKWWWRQRIVDDRIEFRLGVIESFMDLFDVNTVAGSDEDQFTNQLLAGNPTIPHANAMGVYMNVWPTDWLFIRAAIIDPESRARRT